MVEIKQSYIDELCKRGVAQQLILANSKEIGCISPETENVLRLTVARERILKAISGMHPNHIDRMPLYDACNLIEEVISQQTKSAEVCNG